MKGFASSKETDIVCQVRKPSGGIHYPETYLVQSMSLNGLSMYRIHKYASGWKKKYYTLHQKKRRFNPSIFPVDPGSLTLTHGHVNFVQWS